MKKAVLLVAAVVFCSLSAYAFDTSALQISLWAPKVQIVPESIDVSGLKFNLPYGSNDNVTGFDFGIVSRNTNMSGIQINLVNVTEEETNGWQISLCNMSGSANGFIIGGFLNSTEGISNGLEIGLVNTSLEHRGVQIGLVNYTEYLVGLQIGIVNIATKSTLPFFPIINFCF